MEKEEIWEDKAKCKGDQHNEVMTKQVDAADWTFE
jgi:hypothetical protein